MSEDEESALIRWCDWKNSQSGLREFEWVLMNLSESRSGESPSEFAAVHPITRHFGVRWLRDGDRISITYNTPVRLPFIHPEEGRIVYTVASITGTLDGIFALKDIEGIICVPTDHSIRRTLRASRSILRYFTEDTHEVVLYEDDSRVDVLPISITDITTELKHYFSHHPERLYDLTPRKFEELVADILVDFGFDVQLTGVTRDKGRDIYAYVRNAVTAFLMFVECKRWKPPRKVGIEVVQRLHGSCKSGGAHKGMIVTTSFFTAPAMAERKLISTDMELCDYDVFRQWLMQYR